MKFIPLAFLLLLQIGVKAQTSENFIIVTIDGVRWQEVFGGVDSTMMNTKSYQHLKKQFEGKTDLEKATRLMPFLHQQLKPNGVLSGNRTQNSLVEVANPYWFSYPGYNEIFTGYPDSAVNSNDKFYNPNVSFLEVLSKQPAFKNKIAVFGSWDRFSYILNDKRSGLLVNDGFRNLEGNLNDFQKLLNQQQHELPKLFHNAERLDYVTFYHALEYLKKDKPRVLVIALGDTDEFAHSGQYDFYVEAIHQSDKWLKILWDYIQSDNQYKNKTTLLITTDHGRGAIEDKGWTSHGSGTKGSNEIWFAAIGPSAKLFESGSKIYQAQFAATIMKALGMKYTVNHTYYKEIAK